MKDSILQAAIQGKLTEQLQSDGDARDLVEEIQEEKAKLIKEGKIRKSKPLPKITEEEIPFDIPDNWCWVRISDIAYLNSGGQYRETKDGHLYIKVSDMNLDENWYEIITSSRKAKGVHQIVLYLLEVLYFPKEVEQYLRIRKD